MSRATRSTEQDHRAQEREFRAAAVAAARTVAEEQRAAPTAAAGEGPAFAGWLSAGQHGALGKAARLTTPRGSHANWVPAPDRPDPLVLLRAQDADRLPDLVPLRWARMSASPFTFFRGSALLMAHDLAATPTSGLHVQLCGDAHLMNFGVFGAPDRSLVFDVNDFDETLPGPWEWDLKRLATSLVIAARDRGFSEQDGCDAVFAAVFSYQEWMARYAAMDNREVWYSRVAADTALTLVKATPGARNKTTAEVLRRARTRDNLRAFSKLTTVVGGVPQFIDDPPTVVHVPDHVAGLEQVGLHAFPAYKATLRDDYRTLLDRYTFVDFARKVVGVGSVGTRDVIVLLLGRDDGDPLILQLKEAGPSVLEAFVGRSRYRNHGHRVVAGQRLMQATGDILLGWIQGTGAGHDRDYYVRQLHDMKGAIPVERVRPAGLALYGGLCGWTLARAHARTGDRLAIAAYLGSSERFVDAVARFAEIYADQAERDYELLTKAIRQGRIEVDDLEPLRRREVDALGVVDRFMPGEALAQRRAQTPAQRLGGRLDGRLKATQAAFETSRLEVAQGQHAERLPAARQVAHDVVMQAPVGAAQPCEVVQVEDPRSVALAQRDGVLDDRHDVAQVVGIRRRPLQLDEQDVARRHRVGLDLQARPQVDAVVELEGVEVEVDAIVGVGAPPAGLVTARPKELALAASRSHRHLAVLLPAQSDDHGRGLLYVTAEPDQVDVAVGALAEGGLAAVLPHREAAQQAQCRPLGARRVDDAVRLGQHASGGTVVDRGTRHGEKVPKDAARLTAGLSAGATLHVRAPATTRADRPD